MEPVYHNQLPAMMGYLPYKMTAYQNYLGGGMLGSIGNSFNFAVSSLSQSRSAKVKAITEALNQYFHGLTNHDDEWESTNYQECQNRPLAAY